MIYDPTNLNHIKISGKDLTPHIQSQIHPATNKPIIKSNSAISPQSSTKTKLGNCQQRVNTKLE